jgi:hypothetical protein
MRLIRIDCGRYDEAIEDVKLLSNLTLMTAAKVGLPAVSDIPQFLEDFVREWRQSDGKDPRVRVFEIVSEIQKALIGAGKLPGLFRPTGILDRATMRAIVELIPVMRKEAVHIDRNVRSYICAIPAAVE